MSCLRRVQRPAGHQPASTCGGSPRAIEVGYVSPPRLFASCAYAVGYVEGCAGSTEAAFPVRPGRRRGRRDRIDPSRRRPTPCGGGDAEPTFGAPAPSTPGLTTEEQAHILQSEAELDDLRNLLLDTRDATADQGVLLRLDMAEQLLAGAIHERDLADRAREAAAYKQDAPSVAESDGSGGGAAPTAEVLSAIAAIGTAFAGLITAWTALRRAKLSAGLT